MKEILIISYFYPPCSLTAAQRPAGWVKYLHNFGYKPIVVTRHWDINMTTYEDQLKSCGERIFVNKNEKYEIHYLPYKSSLRDRIFNSSFSMLKKSSKFLTLIYSITENFSNYFIPYSNIYKYAENIINQRSIYAFIITANPYNQFRFGYLLSKKFHIPWIADYRDDWTTSEINTSIIHNKLLLFFNKISEKKWVSSASIVTSVSKYYTDKISDFVGVKGEVLLNGFETENYTGFLEKATEDGVVKIVYNGSLYDTQPIELFLDVIREINIESEIKIKLYFPGLAFDNKQSKRVLSLVEDFKEYVYISDRVTKSKVLQLQFEADILLMVSHTGYKGIPSSKLYEYLGFKKPILFFPTDNDIVEEILRKTQLGLIFETKETLKVELLRVIDCKQKNIDIGIKPDIEIINSFTNFNQTKILAYLLNQIIL